MQNFISKYFRLYFFIILAFIKICEVNTAAQNNYNFNQFIKEGGTLAERPIKWNLGDWLKVGGLAAGTYAIMHFDDDIRTSIQTDKRYDESFPIEIKGEFYIGPAKGMLMVNMDTTDERTIVYLRKQ